MQWTELVDRIGEALVRSAYRILRHEGDSRDVVQDVLAEAFLQHQKLGREPDIPLLRHMTNLRSIDRLRQKKRDHSIHELDVCANTADPMSVVQANEEAARIRSAIGRLAQREAECFSLRYIEGLSNIQIAEHLGINTSAVSTALNRARSHLRAELSTTSQMEAK